MALLVESGAFVNVKHSVSCYRIIKNGPSFVRRLYILICMLASYIFQIISLIATHVASYIAMLHIVCTEMSMVC